ncbi:MAG: DUF1461 domain-containing protein [Clostridiales bacterium]|nr:DUF1461 domain-containing protein [Clostridiales bacterium]
MKKEKITSRQRIAGCFLGITLALLMLVLSGTATITSGDFWLRQNEKNNHTQTLNLASNDDYNNLYHHYIGLLEGKVSPDKSETVTLIGSLENFEKDILTFSEREQLNKASNIIKIETITASLLVALASVLVILTVKKQKRQAFLGIGFYLIVSAIVFAIIINVLVKIVPSSWGFNIVFNFENGSTSDILLGQRFMSDFASGFVRFFDFIMLAPLFIGYILTKLSKSNKEDPNEDYLYQ